MWECWLNNSNFSQGRMQKKKKRCQIWHQMGQIWDFLKINFLFLLTHRARVSPLTLLIVICLIFILALGTPFSCLVPCPLQRFPELPYLMWVCFALKQIINWKTRLSINYQINGDTWIELWGVALYAMTSMPMNFGQFFFFSKGKVSSISIRVRFNISQAPFSIGW